MPTGGSRRRFDFALRLSLEPAAVPVSAVFVVSSGQVEVVFSRGLSGVSVDPPGFFVRVSPTEYSLTSASVLADTLDSASSAAGSWFGGPTVVYDGSDAAFLDDLGRPVPPFSIVPTVV